MAVHDLDGDEPGGAAAPRRRRAPARARTLSIKRLSKRELARGAAEFPPDPELEALRPRTWDDCERAGWGEHEACPWVSCRHHLAHDVNPRTGSIKTNHPGREIDELDATCTLRVAERRGHTLEEVADLLNLTRERVRQLEARALARLRETPLAALFAADMRTEVHEPWQIVRGPGHLHIAAPANDARPTYPHVPPPAALNAARPAVLAALAELRFGTLAMICRRARVSSGRTRSVLAAAHRRGEVSIRGGTYIWRGARAAEVSP